MSGDVARASVWVAAPPAVAFDVFTSDVDLWWRRGPAFRFGDGGSLRFDPGPDGRLVETYPASAGEDEWEVGRVREWTPGVRLRFDFRIPSFSEGQSTEVVVTFEGEGDGTRVTVEHRGWEHLPPGHPAHHGRTPAESSLEHAGLWMEQLRAFRLHRRRGS